MDRSVRYHPLFECDVREAAGWYDRRSEGLGDAFADLVRAAVDEILNDPERFASITDGLRYKKVARFPYVVLFDISETELQLLGVLHTARSIDKWKAHRQDF